MGRVINDTAQDFFRQLERNPIVPAARGDNGALKEALAGDFAAIFVLGGDLFSLIAQVELLDKRPRLFVNVDLVGGVAPDAAGIRFLSRYIDGIISTHRYTIELAKENGLITIHRLFAIDSGALRRGLNLIRKTNPDCVEILPGLAYPEISQRYRQTLSQPALAGGLIKTPDVARTILRAGAAGVSTSSPALWGLDLDPTT